MIALLLHLPENGIGENLVPCIIRLPGPGRRCGVRVPVVRHHMQTGKSVSASGARDEQMNRERFDGDLGGCDTEQLAVGLKGKDGHGLQSETRPLPI